MHIFGSTNANTRGSAISFSIPGIHPHDIAEILNREQIAIRAGFHCAEPLHRLYKLPGTARLSLAMYNTIEDIDKLVEGIMKVKKIFA